MAIDIKHVNTGTNNRISTPAGGKNAATTAPQSNAANNSSAAKTDSVSITSQAQQLQSVQSKLNDIPEVDSKKVEEIKAAIAEGRYKIDAEKLASNIEQFENELNELS
ncbi:flagellar biosynthesis anti-sigma factor FlgM [Shewanella waksmanii]|uniref:flagellar biosynthesis anti-sigma factor FlgM n=1 Tax=Shewanella waksmanii TaxID=213783 RepID=UPI003734EA29